MIFIHRGIFWNVQKHEYIRYMQALKRIGFEPEQISVNGKMKKITTREQIEDVIKMIDNHKAPYRNSRETLIEVKNRLVDYLS